MTKDEALKLALEAMESDLATYHIPPTSKMLEAITAVKKALAQPEQEPMAWIWKYNDGDEEVTLLDPQYFDQDALGISSTTPLYTAPPQPEHEPVAWMCHPLGDMECEFSDYQECENCIPLYTTPPQRKPLTDEQIDEEFKLYASQFDTSSDKWLDMGADDYFKAGFKAAHGIKE